jgi:hypothetical protein
MRCKTIVVLIYPHGDPQKHTYKSYPNIIELPESPCQLLPWCIMFHGIAFPTSLNFLEILGNFPSTWGFMVKLFHGIFRGRWQ